MSDPAATLCALADADAFPPDYLRTLRDREARLVSLIGNDHE